jgi:UDP-N-acetylglucosamine 2-epimerase (non-hydrolysing)
MTMRKVAVFTGTRADYGLLYWLMKDIDASSELQLQLIVSGSHLSPEFGFTVRQIEVDGFVIDDRIEILLSSDSPVGVAKGVGLGLLGFSEALSRLRPDVVVLLGDRFEALAMAQTALFLRIPVLHLHGGEVTEGAYDDAIRHAITKLSHYHGVSTEEHRKRVIQLGEAPQRVVTVGAVGLDQLKRSTLLSRDELSEVLAFDLAKPYFVVTYHPVTLADESAHKVMTALFNVLDDYPEYQMLITYPNADDGGRMIIRRIDAYAAGHPQRVFARASLGQQLYLSAVKHAAAVIGNSSSGVIEVPSFGVPTVNIGQRQQGRIAALSVIHCTGDEDSLRDALQAAIARDYPGAGGAIRNPYGDGNASQKIIELLRSMDLSVVKHFYDLPPVMELC